MTTKKKVAKTSIQKATSRKRIGKSAKRVLARAEGPQCFWVNDGQILADLLEFSNALSTMPLETYAYHVKDTHNDFADWIEFVLGDTELASLLREVKKPKQARTVVIRRLKIYDI